MIDSKAAVSGAGMNPETCPMNVDTNELKHWDSVGLIRRRLETPGRAGCSDEAHHCV